MATATPAPLYKLKGSDNEIAEVEEKVLKMSVTMRTMLADTGADEQPPRVEDEPIQIQNVTGVMLKKVFEWCAHHKEDPEPTGDEEEKDTRADPIPDWDKTFLEVDQGTLFEIILAANYLDIKGLLDVSCKTVAHMIRGKTPQQIRDHFGIENDFAPGEEERIRKENEWCEEK